MAIQDDFSVDFVNKNLATTQTYSDGIPPNIYSMNEFYSWLQNLFDEPANMDIDIPMSAQTPTEYTLVNGWFIDDETVKSLFGGSLTTDAGSAAADGWTRVTGTTVGIVQFDYTATVQEFVASDIGKPIVSSAGDEGVLLAFSAVATGRGVCWVRPDTSAAADDWDSTATTFSVTGGTGDGTQTTAAGTGLTTWGNPFSLGSVEADTELYVIQVNNFFEVTTPILTKISRWWTEDTDFTDPNGAGGATAGHIDLLIKVRERSTLIDCGCMRIFARQHGTTYSFFEVTLIGGRTPIPLGTLSDLNNTTGYRHNIATTTSGTLVVGEVVTGGTSGAEGIVTLISGANPNQIFDYHLIGKSNASTGALVDFSGSEALSAPGGYAATSGTLSDVGPAADTSITITFGHDATFDIDEDDTTENYGIVIDCNSQGLDEVFERTKYLTRRGETSDIDSGAQSIIGESYTGIGDVSTTYDGEGGSGPCREGEAVTQDVSGATGIITELYDGGTTGYVIIRQVRGTFDGTNDIVEDGDAARYVTPDITPVSIPQVPAAPFGNFAGGVFFGATGVVLDNVPAADANNYQLTDSEGNQVLPPNKVTVEITGVVAGDRCAIFRVDTAGGTDVTRDEYSIDTAGHSVGDNTIVVDGSITADTPGKTSGGWIRTVDVTDDSEQRYQYSSWATDTFTLTNHADFDGTTDSLGTGTTLNDSTTDFLTNGAVQVGHEIRNVTDASIATVTVVADGVLTTTPLTGGTDDTWQSGDTYEINHVTVALVDADTAYVPLVDGVATTTSISATVTHSTDIDCVARVRQSTAGTKILPFVSKGQTVTDSGLSVSTIRTDDPIVT